MPPASPATHTPRASPWRPVCRQRQTMPPGTRKDRDSLPAQLGARPGVARPAWRTGPPSRPARELQTNIGLYPEWQATFREHRPKTLIVWGKHDPFFIPPGAWAYLNDLPEAKLIWLDSGHFVLDENAP